MNAPSAAHPCLLLIAALSAISLGCGSDEAPPPAPPEDSAARWAVPATREAAPPPIPSAALTKPVMSEAERRAIAEARVPPPAPGAGAVATEPTRAPTDAPPAGPAALSAEDLAALRDDPAAHALPDPAPISEPAAAAADIPRAVLSPPDAPQPASPPPAAERVAPPVQEGSPGADGSARRGVEISASSDASLTLLDLAIATAVVDREPEGASNSFDSTPPLFLCYSSFDQRNESATVTHVWTWNDREMARVELDVGKSPKWRTWSRQRLQPDQAGRWSCEVLGPDGARLGIARVTVGR